MNPSDESGTGGFDWASVIQGAGQGAQSAMNARAANQGSKAEAKEAKRRMLANLFNNSLKRRQNYMRMGQDHNDEMNDFQTQALQNVARGFVESLQGSSLG
jgi:hypothetical protein